MLPMWLELSLLSKGNNKKLVMAWGFSPLQTTLVINFALI